MTGDHDHEHEHDDNHDHADRGPSPAPPPASNRSPEDDQLLEAARDVLTAAGPLEREDLSARLAKEGHDPDQTHLDELLNTDPRVRALADGRLVDVHDVLEAMTLTHRLTEEECAEGKVLMDPDFSPLALLMIGQSRNVIGGGHIAFEDADGARMVTGPKRWLKHADPDDPLAIIVVGPLFSVMIGGELIERNSGEVAAFLRSTFDELPGPVDLADLILEAMAREPELLIQPVLPLSELMGRAALQLDAGRVLPA